MHDARGSTAFAENTPGYYQNMEFDDEIDYRQRYLECLYGTPGGAPEHGSHDESNIVCSGYERTSYMLPRK